VVHVLLVQQTVLYSKVIVQFSLFCRPGLEKIDAPALPKDVNLVIYPIRDKGKGKDKIHLRTGHEHPEGVRGIALLVL